MLRFLLFEEVLMKRILSIFIVLLTILTVLFPVGAYAEGEGNIDHGGGNIGGGTGESFWTPGDKGVRITVVRASDHTVVTTPVDFTNKGPGSIQAHFGKVTKYLITTVTH